MQTNQVCTYKYAVEQQQFGEGQQQAIAIGAVVEVSCSSGTCMPDLTQWARAGFQPPHVCINFFAHYIARPVSEKKYAYLFVCLFVFCFAVGTYNDTSATEYCMKVRDTSLTGPMFPENKQTR